VLVDLTLFCVGSAYRKLIAALILLTFFGTILLIADGAFWTGWLHDWIA
jgi:hypothetical protein